MFGAKKNDPPATAPTPQGYAVYQVTEIQPPQTPTFEQIKAKVEEQFKDQRAQALLAQKTQELSDRAHADMTWTRRRRKSGATVKTSDLVDRTAQVPDIGAMSWRGRRRLRHEDRRNQRSDSGWCRTESC